TPFTLGLAGYRLARRKDVPLIVSYHTPTSEYASYLAPNGFDGFVAGLSDRYERWFLERADLVLAPSEVTTETLRDRMHESTPVHCHPNGVDVRHFRPVDTTEFDRRYGITRERPVIGYTGRHGFEKNLEAILEAAAGLDVQVILGGDGPARNHLEERATELAVDATFLGFLDREELPAFYSTLDVFAFPSPVETEGIVAEEANACGTPVVGVNRRALAETIHEDETGYHFEPGAIDEFRSAIERAISNVDRLSTACLERRDEISVDRALDRLEAVFDRVL
ncbi:MAG: glycosyltransferase, partial [Halodesulfurarchaeum sp.]